MPIAALEPRIEHANGYMKEDMTQRSIMRLLSYQIVHGEAFTKLARHFGRENQEQNYYHAPD
jgi:hypothetical protein